MKTLENVIQLDLLAVDFKDTDFLEGFCAIEKAVGRQLNIPSHDVIECVDWVYVDLEQYNHEWYGLGKFNADQQLAEQATAPDQVIRTIILTKQK